MIYAYDLDGTLFDSYDAVLAAYTAVGVIPPPDFFGKPWRDWLDDPKKHDEKNEVYAKNIHLLKPLPLMSVFRETKNNIIITGASQPAVIAIARHFRLTCDMLYYELDAEGKCAVLNAFNSMPGIVFDDDINAVNLMRSKTEWTVCHVLS